MAPRTTPGRVTSGRAADDAPTDAPRRGRLAGCMRQQAGDGRAERQSSRRPPSRGLAHEPGEPVESFGLHHSPPCASRPAPRRPPITGWDVIPLSSIGNIAHSRREAWSMERRTPDRGASPASRGRRRRRPDRRQRSLSTSSRSRAAGGAPLAAAGSGWPFDGSGADADCARGAAPPPIVRQFGSETRAFGRTKR